VRALRPVRAALAAAALALAAPRPGAAESVRPAPQAPAAARAAVQVASVEALPPEAAEAMRSAVSEEMTRLGIPGLSLALGGGGEIRLETAFGWACVENEVAATPDTVYRLASISKPVTAVAALQLAGKRRLDLDAPVWRYCPAYPPKPWTVTPRLLLAHQGGVRGYRPGEPPQTRHYATVAEGLMLFASDPLAYEPGTAVAYTTYGYCLLGCAVEGAAGRPFAEVLREQVLEPASMSHTAPENLQLIVPHRASGYRRGRTGELVNSPLADMSYKVPGGGLVGTAPDVVRFGLALLNGRLLSRPMLEQMLTPQRTRRGRVTGFGLGLAVGRRGGRREAWHIGGQEQVSTILYLRPESGLVLAMLSNLEKVQDPLLDLARRVADLAEADRVYR
jgi:serine beta-lactamase-like protein LACTB, mitochondrial